MFAIPTLLPLAEEEIEANEADIDPHVSIVTSFASTSPTTVNVPVNESVVSFKKSSCILADKEFLAASAD